MIVFWLIFLVGFLIVAYHVFALLYHWLKYANLYPAVWLAIPIYAVGTGFLFLTTLTALVALST